MNTENTRQEELIDLGVATVETKGSGSGDFDTQPPSPKQRVGLVAD